MKVDEFTLAGQAGPLSAVRWSNPHGSGSSPRYLVLLCHGYGEHMGRYHHVAQRLVADGAVVYGVDHGGHGKSAGERVLITDFEALGDDFHLLEQAARRDHPSLPVVLIGHSMGGTIAARYAQRFGTTLACLVLSAPAIGTWPPLDAMLALPEIPDEPLDPAALSRDLSVGSDYAADPLVWHGAFRRPTLESMRAAMGLIDTGRVPDALPVLWIHGTDDQIVPYADTEAGWRHYAPALAQAKVYEGARHECFNEINRDEVLDDVVVFINQHLPVAGK